MNKRPFILFVQGILVKMTEGFGKAILGDEWNVHSGD